MIIGASSENYLEAILIISNQNGFVRNTDIAEYMGHSKPSVTNAIRVLRNKGYVNTDTDKHIHLTEKGYILANNTYKKHEFFKHHLISIGVDKGTVTSDACRLEHAISDKSFEFLKRSLA